MSEALQVIQDHFQQSIIVKKKSFESLHKKIAQAGQACIDCLINEKKIFELLFL